MQSTKEPLCGVTPLWFIPRFMKKLRSCDSMILIYIKDLIINFDN